MNRLLIYHFFLRFSFLSGASAQIQQGDPFCTYSVSGTYCWVPRYILYAFYFCGLFYRNIDWVVGATFGTAMLFSCVASIHLILLAVTDTHTAWDPDAVPALSIVCCGLLAGSTLIIWSSSFHSAKKSTRLTVLAWMSLSVAGLIAGLRYEEAELYPAESVAWCRKDIPMRAGQPVVVGYFGTVFALPGISYWVLFKILFPPEITLALVCGASRLNPISLIRALDARRPLPRFWRILWLLLVVVLQVAIWVLVLVETGTNEYSFFTNSWTQGEDLTSVGQWGRAVETVFAFGVAAVLAWFKQRDTKRAKELESHVMSGQTPLPCGCNHSCA